MNLARLSKLLDSQAGLPLQPFPSLPAVAARARVMLISCTADQAKAAAKRIKHEIGDERDSEVDALKAVIERRDYTGHTSLTLPKPKKFPEGHDHQLFAVLSLSLLSDAIHFLNKTPINVSAAGECALRAMDAVCFAEHLYESSWLMSYAENMSDKRLMKAILQEKTEHQEWIKKDAERRRREASERGKQLNTYRHKEDYEANDKAIAEWKRLEPTGISPPKAGVRLSAWLKSQGFNIEPDTITRWIREHRKQESTK